MKIELLNVGEMINVNKLQEVTSPRLFSNKMMFDPKGILSSDIFGVSAGDKRNTFAWIDLKGHYLQPHIYANVLKRMWRNIIYIVSGQKKFSINSKGKLVEDQKGWTGLASLYDKWDTIDWSKQGSTNTRNIKLLNSLKRDEVFVTRWMAIPPAYRDVTHAGTKDSSDHVHLLNKHYQQLIREVSLVSGSGLFLRNHRQSQLKIQDRLVEIFNYLRGQIDAKTGLIKKHLLGKNVDFGSRSVISAPLYNSETIQDNMVDIEHMALPIAQCCSTYYPYIESWLINFFTREIINDPKLIALYDPVGKKEIVATLTEPEVQFSDKAIRKMINDFVLNPNNRFKVITVAATLSGSRNARPVEAYMLLKGKKILKNNVQQNLKRPMTVTDVLYLACVDVCEKRHVMVTRYPVGTDKGLFFNKIRVQSTRSHIHLIFNGREYPYYPDIPKVIEPEKIGIRFVDTAVFSNSLLDGMGGDYDGDQVSILGLYTDEANHEAELLMAKKMTALNITGGNSRIVSKEMYNSYYALTKLGRNPKIVNITDRNTYLRMKPDEFTRSKIADMFADMVDGTSGNTVGKKRSKHNTWDKFTIPSNYFYQGQKQVDTTIGRFMFNKYVLEGANVIGDTKVLDILIDNKGLGFIDSLIGDLLKDDVINRKQFNDYIDRRDNFGYWINGMLVHSVSEKMLKPLPRVTKRKAELVEKHREKLDNGNIDVMTAIEEELIALAREELIDDPGMDLYLSGDLNFDNNYKNNSILKGPVKNEIDGTYDFIASSFMDGIEVDDMAAHANSILSAQYPASIATRDSGYMGKKLMALLQMVEVDEEDTDCGTKALIPIAVSKHNADDLLYTYFDNGGQLSMLDKSNINNYIGKTIMARSPMSCITTNICSKCAGNLFYKLDIKQAGLFATQLSHSALNAALKSKHSQVVSLYTVDPNTVIQDV